VLNDPGVREYLEVHEHEGIGYYRKESFDELIEWLSIASMVRAHEQDARIPPVPQVALTSNTEITIFKNIKEVVTRLRNLSSTSEYKIAALMARLQKSTPPAAAPIERAHSTPTTERP